MNRLTLGHYWKYIIAAIGYVAVIVNSAYTDHVITPGEMVQIVVGIGTALTIYILPNAPVGWGRYIKEAVAVLGFIASVAIPMLTTGGFRPSILVNIAIQAIVALGVVAKGNIPMPLVATTSVTNNFVTGEMSQPPGLDPTQQPPAQSTIIRTNQN
jgi:hypothetical protein